MLKGLLKYSLPIAAASFLIGLVLALAAALARLSANFLVQLPSRVFVSVIRGTPLLVQLYIVFYGLGQIGLKIDPVPAAILALSLNVGGYAAEIIRASILSVPRGQYEAATTIGMRYPQLLRRIVLPQAARIAVPPLSNTLLSLIKDTSLASIILVPEMLRQATNAASSSGQFMPLYLLAALFYWVVCFLVSLAQDPLEKRLGRHAA
jgi:His/Glu/Gln/Arg/opine family amino acid ABC transporter permease subunit